MLRVSKPRKLGNEKEEAPPEPKTRRNSDNTWDNITHAREGR
jgi:hypothetical protein